MKKESVTKDGYSYIHNIPELNLEKRIGITKEVHDILKKERKKQRKSMARIVNDLIINSYEKN